jgi:GMP synthase-like glutamine amidotransferase
VRVLSIHQEAGSSLCTLEEPVRDLGHDVIEWHPYRGEAPPPLAGLGALVALGGLANPDEDATRAWLACERDVLARAHAAGLPVLGLCLGAQLLAQALGGEARRLPQGETGWIEVVLQAAAADDALLCAFPPRFPAYAWHDYGFTPPPGAVALARSERSPYQAFRAGERAWGLQFHAEVDASTAEAWAWEARAELPARGVDLDLLVSDTRREIDGYAWHARAMMERFLALAEAVAA